MWWANWGRVAVLAAAGAMLMTWFVVMRDAARTDPMPPSVTVATVHAESAHTVAVAWADSVARLTRAVTDARARLAAHRAEDAAHERTDAAVRDSLNGVVAGAVARADSVTAADSVRAVLRTVVAAGSARAATDSAALARLAGRLTDAVAVIQADSTALRAAALALTASQREVATVRTLATSWQGVATRAQRSARLWQWAAAGAAIVAVARH
jgi:hypothetical protein